MNVSVIGAAAIRDYIFSVERLPSPGEVALIHPRNEMEKPYWGGCAPNIAVGLARLGIPVNLVYPVGEDFPGSGCEAYWRSQNLDLTNLCPQPGLPSGVAYLFFQPYAETMCFSALGAAASATPRADVRLGEVVVITPVCGAFTLFYLEQSLRQRRKIAISGVVSAEIVDALRDIQVVILNAHEAETLCKLCGVANLARLASAYPDCCFYITQSHRGSQVLQGRHCLTIPIISPQKYVDPTGAGDAYTAGVIMAWLRGYDAEVGGYIGATCASFVLEAFGAQTNLPSLPMVIHRLTAQAPNIRRRIDEESSD